MTVFLTGVTGFVGSRCAKVLSNAGNKVIGLIRNLEKVKEVKAFLDDIVVGDLGDEKAIIPALQKSDAVVHIAGVVKALDPQEFFRSNTVGTQRLASLTLSHALHKRFIYISSLAAQGPYDFPRERPENMVETPISEYGRSKLLAERALLAYSPFISVTILRPPIIYGPNDTEFIKVIKVASFTNILPVVNPNQTFSIIHVSDVAKAVLLLLEKRHETPSVFTLDDGHIYTWKMFANILGQVLGKRIKVIRIPALLAFGVSYALEVYGRHTGNPIILSGDKIREALSCSWIAGNNKIRELGFSPSVGLFDGLRDTIDWAKCMGVL